MARARLLQNNFTSGELSPRMRTRQDFAKYGNGLETLTNYGIFPHGGVTRRHGTRFVNEAKTSSSAVRLIPFEFSVTQAYILEFGHEYIRLYTLSGLLEFNPSNPVEITTPYQSSELFDIQFAQSADVLYLVHPNHQPRKLERFGPTIFTLTAIEFQDGPYLDENTDHTDLLTVSGNTGTITVTATGHSPFLTTHVGSVWRLNFGSGWGSVRVSSYTSATEVDAEVEEPFGEILNINAVAAGQPLRDNTGGDSLAQGLKFQADTTLHHLEVKLQKIGTPTGGNVWLELRQADLTSNEPLKDAIDVSEKIDVSTIDATAGGTWTTFKFDTPKPGNPDPPILDRGVQHYVVLRGDFAVDVADHIEWRESSGSIYEDGTGYSLDSGTGNWTDTGNDFAVRNITTDRWREGAWSDRRGWPDSITLFEQRLFLGQLQTFDGSVINDFETFSPNFGNDPPIAENAVRFTIASTQVNKIQWLAGVEDLFIGTAGSEHRVIEDTAVGITPNNPPLVREISKYGGSRVQPIRAGKNLVYVSRSRNRIWQIGFDLQSDSFDSIDLYLLAEHLGKKRVKQLGYAQDPDPIIYAVYDDGDLGAAAYLRSQDVIGWSTYTTDGNYESVAVIPHEDGDVSQVWVVVNRTIDGATKRYIEYLEHKDGEYGPLFLDSGLSYSGTATSTLSGLDHLEGKTVEIIGNQAVYPPKTVVNGQITGLDPQVTSADVGLGYTSLLKDLRPVVNTGAGQTFGLPISSAKTTISLLESLGLIINGDVLEFRKAGDPMDSPPPIFSGDKDVFIEGWDETGQVTVEQRQGLPSTILGITRSVETGEI